ncbi:hypothetical protein [Vibrio sp. HN007]|uniref:hypothetical protein n=1 Tax=Vibrio iocasae TaxID=3098914 RepID=UPI0035D4D6F2
MKRLVFTLAGLALTVKLAVIVMAEEENVTAPEEIIEGCYSQRYVITDYATESSETKTSYLQITKSEGTYHLKGWIWGDNYHVCDILVPDGETQGNMEYADGVLTFSVIDEEYGINCNLEMINGINGITVRDRNYHCTDQVFYCGVRVGLDGLRLKSTPNQCEDS